jgi:predicted polyphosphate/ATP-dependent NAD kinase
MSDRKFRLGLIMNPLAGLGGAVALKGSDGEETVKEALALGATSHVAERTRLCLDQVQGLENVKVLTVASEMGASVAGELSLDYDIVYTPAAEVTTADDTRAAVEALEGAGIDLLLFAGGDGTARDICDAVDEDQPVLGVPCGVKMHSGVFANSPSAAARVLQEMIDGSLVSVVEAEVRDIDEEAFRKGVLRARHYGDMWVPEELRYIQQVKAGGKEVEALVLQEIAAHIVENMAPGVTYFVGSGSTTAEINQALGLENTLLGVDVVRDGELLKLDATDSDLLHYIEAGPCHIVVTIIGGQGHFFGRGNQQFSPNVIRGVGVSNITVIATKTKLEALEDRGLHVDTGDPVLDDVFSGNIRVVTGYDDSVLIRVSAA